MGEVEGVPQYMHALGRANEVRLARAAIKRDVAAGTVSVAQLLDDPPAVVENVPIGELLTWAPRWGRSRMLKVICDVPVPEYKPVGQMTERQRRETASLLNDPKRRATPAYRREPVAA